jgi:hypothetical protein
MRPDKTLFLLIVFVAGISFAASAQIRTSFTFGNVLTSSQETVSFSGPVIIEGKNACFSVKNGVPLFDDANARTGKFMISCLTNDISDFELVSFPNPVLSSARIYASGKINPEDKFTLSVYTSAGELLHIASGNLGQFKTGLSLNLLQYPGGVYFVRVHTKTVNKTFKIVKAGE